MSNKSKEPNGIGPITEINKTDFNSKKRCMKLSFPFIYAMKMQNRFAV
jgi:hypothetical protein